MSAASGQWFAYQTVRMPSLWHRFKLVDFRYHLFLSFLIHLALIHYGRYHDEIYPVPYTDVDYKVFTDAARYVANFESPYKRDTYRYTPIVAYLLLLNVLLCDYFGKLLFSAVNIVVALLIRAIVRHNLHEFEGYRQSCDENKLQIVDDKSIKRRRKKQKNGKSDVDISADFAMILWLYNPMAIAIATRGNCDAIAGVLVLSTLYVVQIWKNSFLAGILHGVAVHVRLYPIAYSLALFMHLSDFGFYSHSDRLSPIVKLMKSKNKKKVQLKGGENALDSSSRRTVFKIEYLYYLIPNREQFKLVVGCITSLSTLIGAFYLLYGEKFLHETYLYHLTRKDTRHNFSMYFYLQYLTAGIKNVGFWQNLLITLPQVILLLLFSVRYGLNRLSLNFAFLTLTIVMVAYNTVLTSQYFIWILVILPLCVWQIQMSKKSALFLVTIWFVAKAAWLLPAYFLEFQGHNTFMFVWIQSISFFCANMAILGRIIKCYMIGKIQKVN